MRGNLKEVGAWAARGLSIAALSTAALVAGEHFLVRPLLAGFERDRIECLREQTGRTTPPDDQPWNDLKGRLRLTDPTLDSTLSDQQTTAAFDDEHRKWKRAQNMCKVGTAQSAPLFP